MRAAATSLTGTDVMDTTPIIHELKATLTEQLRLAGEGSELANAGEMLLALFGPSLERALLSLADQAVTEVQAQLPDHEVSLTIREGRPEIRVRDNAPHQGPVGATDDLQARLTLRLPEMLKAELEAAAGSAGDSINSYIIKSLAGRRRGRPGPRQIRDTFET